MDIDLDIWLFLQIGAPLEETRGHIEGYTLGCFGSIAFKIPRLPKLLDEGMLLRSFRVLGGSWDLLVTTRNWA